MSTRQYNSRGQLTRQTVPGEVDLEYRFSSTANDGRLWQRKDHVSGEEVTYQYDQLGRLIAAATTGPEWGQSFVYDGFGNLTQQVVTKGTAPSMSMLVDANTNRLIGTGITYDPVGNMTSNGTHTLAYDRKNRLKEAAGETYLYSHRNERVLVTKAGGAKEINFYGAFGELIGVYTAELNPATGYRVAVRIAAKERIYLGGRLITLGGEKVIADRLGSVVRKGTQNYRCHPHGQEIGGATANDTDKFATYLRDQSTGLDYARNRYYTSQWGRFTSPDPHRASGGPADPGSWNRYNYVVGDPVNFNDRLGLLANSVACGHEGGAEACLIDDPTLAEYFGQTPTQGGPGAEVGCNITVASMGQPRKGQDVSRIERLPYTPTDNRLGKYSTIGRRGIPPSAVGWFFAVQVQGNLVGDTNPSNWTPTQTTWTNGTVTIQAINGTVTSIPHNSSSHDDSPLAFAVKRNPDTLDWLDIPGFRRYQTDGYVVTGADITIYFKSTLTHTNGASCSVNWSVHLTVSGNKWDFFNF